MDHLMIAKTDTGARLLVFTCDANYEMNDDYYVMY